MPDYFAHTLFGARVLEQLDAPLRERVEQEHNAFYYGLFGPDPLFFYQPQRRTFATRSAYAMHHRSVRLPLMRYRRLIREQVPYATGYAAGLVCHFALDHGCHPYVDRRAGNGGSSHIAIEAEFDRMLMEEQGIDALRTTPMHHPAMSDDFYIAASVAYDGATPQIMKQALAGFYRVSRLFTIANGGPLSAVAALAGKLPGCENAAGLMLRRQPASTAAETNAALAERFDQALPTAREEMVDFFDAIAAERPFGDWADGDFHGGCGAEDAFAAAPMRFTAT